MNAQWDVRKSCRLNGKSLMCGGSCGPQEAQQTGLCPLSARREFLSLSLAKHTPTVFQRCPQEWLAPWFPRTPAQWYLALTFFSSCISYQSSLSHMLQTHCLPFLNVVSRWICLFYVFLPPDLCLSWFFSLLTSQLECHIFRKAPLDHLGSSSFPVCYSLTLLYLLGGVFVSLSCLLSEKRNVLFIYMPVV